MVISTSLQRRVLMTRRSIGELVPGAKSRLVTRESRIWCAKSMEMVLLMIWTSVYSAAWAWKSGKCLERIGRLKKKPQLRNPKMVNLVQVEEQVGEEDSREI